MWIAVSTDSEDVVRGQAVVLRPGSDAGIR